MGQVLHGSATTTEAIRRAIQRSEESVRALARRHGISPTTVQKWRRRRTTADARMGPKEARSTTLSPEQEAMAVAFRRHTLLPLDDCLYALQPSIPELTRSGLHRCFARHGISRLPKAGDDGAGKKRFKAYPIGYFHLDIAEVRTEQGKLHLFVAIDRTSKFAFARLHEKATRRVAADFLHALVEAVPYRVHTVLTDNGVRFTDTLPADEDPEAEAAIDAIWAARGEPRLYRVHAFDHACERHGIEHRLTKPYHPWTNGQVERMNRTLKDATVRRYHYGSHDELRTHLALFLDAYNHARRLKAIRGLTPYEFICQAWTREPERFRLNPLHHTPGLNT
jgi:transposase InsO family protein